jgi:hypothetical protein
VQVCKAINPNHARRLLEIVQEATPAHGHSPTTPAHSPTTPAHGPAAPAHGPASPHQAERAVYAVKKPEQELGELDQVMCDGRVQVRRSPGPSPLHPRFPSPPPPLPPTHTRN